MTYVKHTPLKVPVVDSFFPKAPYASGCYCRICLKVRLNNDGNREGKNQNPQHQPQWICLAQYRLMQVKSRYKFPDWKLRGYMGFNQNIFNLYYTPNPRHPSSTQVTAHSLDEFYSILDNIVDNLLGAQNEKGKQDDPAVKEGTLTGN